MNGGGGILVGERDCGNCETGLKVFHARTGGAGHGRCWGCDTPGTAHGWAFVGDDSRAGLCHRHGALGDSHRLECHLADGFAQYSHFHCDALSDVDGPEDEEVAAGRNSYHPSIPSH